MLFRVAGEKQVSHTLRENQVVDSSDSHAIRLMLPQLHLPMDIRRRGVHRSRQKNHCKILNKRM